MTVIVGAGFGALAAAGVLLVAAGLTGVVPRPLSGLDTLDRLGRRVERFGLRAGLALGGGLVGAVATGWPVAVVLLAATGFTAPSLVGLRGRREHELVRAEAVAAWAEMLRDTIAGGAGLQTAIVASARAAPAAIAPEVERLAGRAQRYELTDAINGFAAEVAEPTADVVVASLLLALRAQARDLDKVLAAAATSARATVAMQRRIEAGRARTYTSIRLIVAVTVGYAIALVVFDPAYLAPFGSAGGQVVLAGIGVLFAAGLASIGRLATPLVRPRLFESEP
ncbi:MAG TPA: hypothetical protein VHA73_05405 [Acidimicrobiales bacterium]|jgi:hypothetical protein|nr:hypothetical protein [Acidimicrobiales bacterium]